MDHSTRMIVSSGEGHSVRITYLNRVGTASDHLKQII